MIHTGAVLRRAALLPLLAVVLLVGGCSDDGRELAPPRPDQTTTTEPPPTVPADGSAFSLTSDAFSDGDPLPLRATCDDVGLSPALSWAGVPTAAELALVVRDRDADGYVHWIVTGIDPVVSGFGEGGVPEGAVEQVNGEGAVGWLPACPPEGDERHVYDFTLHVLEAPLDIDPALPAADVAALVEGAAVASARLSGTATR